MSMKLKPFLLIFLIGTSASAGPVEPPSSGDAAMIEAAVKAHVADPNSMKISHVSVAQNPSAPPQSGWACGQVQSENTPADGTPKMFVALLSKALIGDERVVAHVRIAGTKSEDHELAEFCRAKFQFSREAFAEGAAFLAALQDYSGNDLLCAVAGSPSEQCDKKQNALDYINDAGWCLDDERFPSWVKCNVDG